MPMPETTVYKDDRSVFPEDKIGMAGQSGMIQPVAKATAEQELPDQQFWFGVSAFYG